MERIEKTIIVIRSTDAVNVKNKNDGRNKSPLGNWEQAIDRIQARQWSCKLYFLSNETEKYWIIE